MNVLKQSVCLALALTSLSVSVGQNSPSARMDDSLAAKIRRFAPTELTADSSKLSAGDRQALQKIIAAAKYLDPLYRRQLWSGSEALLKKLKADKSVAGRERLHYFLINQGPWSQLDNNEVFMA